MIAIVDAGPLYALVDERDVHHIECLRLLDRPDLQFVIPVLVLAEVSYLLGERMGASAEAQFCRHVGSFDVEAPLREEWAAIAELVERYGDFPLGAADASVAMLADRLGTDLIVTLDRRHFATLRSARGRPYQLLPE